MQLSDMLKGESSPFYSFRAAGGMDMWGVMLFFASSPLSIIAALWNKSGILFSANIITGAKIMLCAGTAGVYLSARYSSLKMADRTILSVCYALSGFSMLFYQNSIWVDMAALFPLLYLSFLSVGSESGGGKYCFWLSLSIVVNYYLSYAVLLFLLLAAGCRV